MIDELLKKYKVDYEDLNEEEKQTLSMWVTAAQSGNLTIEKIREHIELMKTAVENELATSQLGRRKDTFLKARLRNYLLLSSLLTTPDKLKKTVERALMGMSGKNS